MKEIKRNPGIDFLRLLAMYLVVVYHLLFHGGILDAGQNSGAAQLLRVLTLCAVDGFALISGYVGLREEKPRFPVNRMARLWLQTLFYSLLMLFIDNLYKTIGQDQAANEAFVDWVADFAKENNMEITMTISADPETASEGMKKYL